MINSKEEIDKIQQTIVDITETARGVNKDSLTRKDMSGKGIQLITNIVKKNDSIKSNFQVVFSNINNLQTGILNSADEFKNNLANFNQIITSIKNSRRSMKVLEREIKKLTRIVEEIKSDTDEIFTLALNASIVSSKYTHTSGVFDIIANKLNEMSNFINQNLESIVAVVQPITDGIRTLFAENEKILDEIERSYNSFVEFSTAIDDQKRSIKELATKASGSGEKISQQSKLLDDIGSKIKQMDEDSDGAINGSSKVIKIGEELTDKVIEISRISGGDFQKLYDQISHIENQASSIWQSAQNVNEKSRSQVEFSQKSVDLGNLIISDNQELSKLTEIFNNQSIENNKLADSISKKLGLLTSQLDGIKSKLSVSNETIQKFNDDYSQIDNILEFLKNILKSMNIIGMYSRIESARDPEEFQGFMTISENIIELQNEIHNNIPVIEENIENTHKNIDGINEYFENITTQFYSVSDSSSSIIEKLKTVTKLSSDSEKFSTLTLNESKDLDDNLQQLRDVLIELTEIVKKPIDGSAENIRRGKLVEELCSKIKKEKVNT